MREARVRLWGTVMAETGRVTLMGRETLLGRVLEVETLYRVADPY